MDKSIVFIRGVQIGHRRAGAVNVPAFTIRLHTGKRKEEHI